MVLFLEEVIIVMKANILLVDDEFEIAEINMKYLTRAGYNVTVVYNGKEALDKFRKQSFDLIITDIMMPEMDGYELIDEIQLMSEKQAFLFITAKSSDQDKIFSLSLGADDYIVKPFSPRELVLRVTNILRRVNEGNNEFTILGNLKINYHAHEAEINGHRLELTVKEFELLWILISDSNHAFSKSELYQKVWHEDYRENIDSNTLNVHIHDLRTKLLENGSESTPKINTVWGLGYKMEE